MKHRVQITLSDKEDDFVKWLAKRDGVSYQEELQMLFYTELRACRELYEAEMKGE